jgi:saccharopine dehydrogenase-like NADP-dependent oxidoreductase
MNKVLILGGGKVGSLIAVLLATSNDYHVTLADLDINATHLKKLTAVSNLELISLDASNPQKIIATIKKKQVQIIVSSLPYFYNIEVATAAKTTGIHYFDLTEDTNTATTIMDLAQNSNSVFVPQCGLAPGFISIIANQLMHHFPTLDTVKMRVGALPINVSNPLQYSLTWSTEGLINEYASLCQAIQNGREISLLPLDDIEEIKIDGLTYEAFNTSGGIGSLVNTYLGKVTCLNYKTIRYPGHCEKMRFLMQDLKLKDHRDVLKHILEEVLPKTLQDVVLVYVSVTGKQDNKFSEENYVKKFYSKKINGWDWSAIQCTTASSLCAVLDLIVSQPGKYKGFVRQEQFSLEEFLGNRFGGYYGDGSN